MYNIFKVCITLCDPVIDPTYSKLHLIDGNFLVYTSDYDVTADTKINADDVSCESQWKQWKEANPTASANFVTEIFFTTLFYAHYGYMSTLRYWYSRLTQFRF
jgi:ubiquitin conjugation factor E4 B